MLEQKAVSANIVFEPFSPFGKHRSLVAELSKREILGRYRGASFGLFWSLISPFLMLLVYTLAFGSVMKAKWPQVQDGSAHYSLILFVGLIVHGFFAECLTRAPLLITSNPNFVKRIIFPLELMPWPMVVSALFHAMMNVVVFVALRVAIDHSFTWQVVILPVVLLPLVVFTLGLSWFLAAAGVYLRDISQVTGVLATAMLFLSSAMFPVSALPENFRFMVKLNPLTFIIDQAREVALWGRLPDWWGLGLYLMFGVVVMYAGYTFFRVTRKGFGDVI
ncbi:MAG: sugar ABC transporter permease [Lysobacterales bacterium 14-68-21]|jgi:lipopolysaccharide transport system permease protein|nr:MAG: sugar ABC transporter permease [Xanthomonadales bacterium 15-68-25]OZB66131.1 MAG: sugar ABC transporter permease [Xanthomonadales bacterium 14-68-21]